MSRKKKTEPEISSDMMVPFLEENIRAILQDANAAPADKVKAVEAGVRLVLAKFKTKGGTTDESYFG